MFVFDFNKCLGERKKVSVNPEGWRGPIQVEYGLAQVNKFHTHVSVVWRVVGTKHTFTEYETTINKYSQSNYAEHFKKTLEGFRDDYLSWWEDQRYEGCDWREEYRQEFGKLIKPNSDNISKSEQN